MVVGEVVNATSVQVENILSAVGSIGLWMQALGLVVIGWIAFEIVFLLFQIKRRKRLRHVENQISRIESKLDKLLKKKK